MRKMVYSSKYYSPNSRAFTLVEILITLTLVGLIFSVLSYGLYSSINSSINISVEAKQTEEEAKFFWDFQRRFVTSKQVFVKKAGDGTQMVVMYNTAGEFSKGVVKSVYFLKDGFIQYYEYPYVFGDPFFYEEKESVRLVPAKSFKVEVSFQGQKFDEYSGKPDYMLVLLNDKKMVFK